ncbi:MAG: chemotaxis protein CheX [Syntrophomonadaceae bacterium]|nr:chemotaxis protein CheX [Syntrophomonadaceae bacterium]
MDVKLINPFLQAFAEILPQIGFNTVEKAGLSLINDTLEYNGVLINISFVGPLKGVILTTMPINNAKQFATKMTMGMEFAEFDAMAQSAVSEMTNMVCANACTQFSQIGMEGLDISPPTVLVSEKGIASLPVPQTIAVNLKADEIKFNVYIAIV